ncbi:MAG: hypothetical protein H8D72_00530, partial [Planctomycetes bacterium]|nr:hypothetical protein [Planctomycetota bacterium]
LLFVVASCSVGHYSSVMQYGDDLVPQPLLSGASPLGSDWSIPGSGHSSHSGPSGWVSSVDFNGTFRCEAEDVAPLAVALFDTLKDDVFGKGFQLREGSAVLTGGKPNAIEIRVLFQDDYEKGTVLFTAQAGAKPPSFEYQLNVSEETR